MKEKTTMQTMHNGAVLITNSEIVKSTLHANYCQSKTAVPNQPSWDQDLHFTVVVLVFSCDIPK